ncbi:LytTR family DNA-binding domain-containing protein [Neolewinella lacunae]|uniref:Response regulator transcription factor n=1 Tax=Neolewinella lacunae TaxID=1517758 RepID=A0A923T9W3_9BACT|nr:LytTR family DNA-binding domain-containing protein [Neolewinella lacunae]MBC6995964.1 response regulator transcription factor [Neolewinella lacunae]MDN3635192.1 LytTR family DNA-binding domain-containing protein [Neolewinella lacunae]
MTEVVLIDDEADARQLLRQYLGELPGFRIVGEAADGPAAVEVINERRPDLLFLDVQLPGCNGFEVLTRLNELPQVIFSTAYDDYALRAFEVHALDYLLKPIGRARFQASIARLEHVNSVANLTESLLGKAADFPAKVILHKGQRRVLVRVEDILSIDAYGDYCKVHLAKETLLAGSGISDLERKLNPRQFLRVHRSHLVNLDHASELERSGRYWHLRLGNATRVRVSDAYLGEIRRLML